ncbi:GNAT family N-acetyltransferase [Flavobacteriaceae bacterium MHTCC 0001]
MKTLKGEHINLRALEPEDLDFVLELENDECIWQLSNTQTPFSRYVIKQYLDHALKDIYEAKQLRLVICGKDAVALGLIDLFDFDFKNKRAGIGIIIKEPENRAKGYGSEALKLLINYSFTHLGLHQLYCNISENNVASIQLFLSHGFEKIGLKKDWNYNKGNFNNEFLFQLINPS